MSPFIGGRVPGSDELRTHLSELFAQFGGLVDAAHTPDLPTDPTRTERDPCRRGRRGWTTEAP